MTESIWADFVRKFEALTPEVEQWKRSHGHGDCPGGWSLSGDPYLARCSCGESLGLVEGWCEERP